MSSYTDVRLKSIITNLKNIEAQNPSSELKKAIKLMEAVYAERAKAADVDRLIPQKT